MIPTSTRCLRTSLETPARDSTIVREGATRLGITAGDGHAAEWADRESERADRVAEWEDQHAE